MLKRIGAWLCSWHWHWYRVVAEQGHYEIMVCKRCRKTIVANGMTHEVHDLSKHKWNRS